MNKNNAPQPPTTIEVEAPPEHHAVLDAIANEAGATELQAVAIDPAEAQTKAQNWAELPAMLGGLLAILEPKVAEIYTQEACLNWGTCMAQVADKYGWGDAPLGCEVPLAIATIGLAAPTYLLVSAKLAQLKAEQRPTSAEQRTTPQRIENPVKVTQSDSTGGGFPPTDFFAK